MRLARCDVTMSRGLLKPGTRDPGSAGIGWDPRSQVLAFGTIGSRVPAFDVIEFTDLISFLPLDSDAVYTGLITPNRKFLREVAC